MPDTVRTQSELLALAPLVGVPFRWKAQQQRDFIVTVFSLVSGAGAPAWGTITGKPTTLAGYGITDAYTQVGANNTFVPISVVDGTGTAVFADPFVVTSRTLDSRIVINGANYSRGGVVSLGRLSSSQKVTVNYHTGGDSYLTTGLVWSAGLQAGGTAFTIRDAVNAADRISIDATTGLVTASGGFAGSGASLTAVPWSALTGTPTTVGGYGITDSYTKTAGDARYAPIAVPWSSITGAPAYALLASPTFTGTPIAPTAVGGTNTTQIATTAFVTSAVAAATTGVSSVFGRSGAVVSASGDYTFAQIGSTPTTLAGYGITDGITAATVSSTYAPKASPTFTGTVTVPTATAGDSTTAAASTAFVATSFATLASPTFTGTPSLPTGATAVTQTAGDSTTKIATTAFVATSFAPLASPTFTGTPTLPTGTVATTQTAGNNSTKVATTAYADAIAALKANLASPTFTGTPLSTTAAAGTNTTQIATTAFVKSTVNPAYGTLTDAATTTWTVTGGAKNNGIWTLGGNRTLAISGATTGWDAVLFIKQPATGGPWGVTLPTGSIVIGTGGTVTTAPTLSTAANAVDQLTVTYDGTNYWWTVTPYTSQYATLASPTFTGTPTLPTGTIATTQSSPVDSSTKIATTAFAQGAVQSGVIYGQNGTTGCLAATYDRAVGLMNFTASQPASGTIRVMAIRLPKGLSITSISFFSGTTAAVTPTNQWFVLLNSALLVLAVTADDTTTAWGTQVKKTLTVASGPFVTTYTGLYYVGYMVAAATVPTMEGLAGGSGAGARALAPASSGNSNTGQTTPITVGTTATSISAQANFTYAELS